MPNHSSSSSKNPLITVVVLLKEKLVISSPILSLTEQVYPASKIELLLIGETRWMPALDILRKLKFKSVKTISHSSKSSFFPHVARLTQGSIVLFTQSDCRPSRQWAQKMVSVFRKNREVGMVLGEVQWRSSGSGDKIGNYCEQIGLDSVWQNLGINSPVYLTLKKRADSADVSIDPIASLLTPTNLALTGDALASLSKASHSLDSGLTREEIGAIENRKMRLFFEPAAMVERCPVMTSKKLTEKMNDKAFQQAVWRRFAKNTALCIRLQFAGEHELVMPFPISVDIAWGDFHWLHLWGIAALWKTLWMCSWGRGGATAWDVDVALFDLSLFGFFAFRYFLPVLKVQPWSDFILWCWLRYRSNMSIFLGGLRASLKFRCFLWAESW